MNSRSAVMLLGAAMLSADMSSAASREMVFPAGSQPAGPYSPGIVFDDVLYVSGQGARDANGNLPVGAEAQTRQCLDKIRAIVEAANYSLANVIYTHTYLANMADYAAVNLVYPQVFTGVLPARSTMGVARMPQETPVEISAIAVRGAAARPVTLGSAQSPVPVSPGLIAGNRLFLSGILGRDAEANATPETSAGQVEMCLSRLERILKGAGLTPRHVLQLNVYRTAELGSFDLEQRLRAAYPDTALTMVDVAALPFGVRVGVTGVATLDLAAKRIHKRDGKTVCTAAGRTVYCASEAADTAGEAVRALDTSLRAMGSSVGNALSVNVFLSDIETFQNMNAVYALQFAQPYPARTTVQPRRAGVPPAVQVSLVAGVMR